MDAKNIPLHEKFNALVKGLAELEPLAADLSRDAIHSQSPHIAPVRSRILAAIEGIGWHAKALAALPDPKPSTAPDATAGAPATE
jgi:hypothetical protein